MNSNGSKPWKTWAIISGVVAAAFMAGMNVTGWTHAWDHEIHENSDEKNTRIRGEIGRAIKGLGIDVPYPVMKERVDHLFAEISTVQDDVAEIKSNQARLLAENSKILYELRKISR